MKSFLCLVFALIAYNLQAQSYDCFIPTSKQYFINNEGYLRGIRIDSIRTSGADKIYFPYHSLRGNYLSRSPVFDTAGGSWLGKAVSVHTDGSYIFDNMWGDSIVIKTRASEGDNWVFFKDTAIAANYYIATISKVDTMTVLGYLDSVKYISLTAYNGSTPVDDSFNRMQIILSKHNGFAQVFDLFTFPYHMPAKNIAYDDSVDYYQRTINSIYVFGVYYPQKQIFTAVQFKIPRDSDFYSDYNVGDMYRYRAVYDPLEEVVEIMDSVTDKVVSTSGTGYGGSELRKISDFSGGGPPKISYAKGAYGVISDTIPAFYMPEMPEEWRVGKLYSYIPDDTSFCTKSALYDVESDDIEIYGSSIYINMETPCGDGAQYKAKIGLISSGHCFSWRSYSSKNLVCFVRAGKMCGSCPPLLTVPKIDEATSEMKMIPNPASDKIVVNFPNKIQLYTVIINNAIGQQIFEAVAKDKLQITCSNFPDGFYMVSILRSGMQPITKKLIVKH